MPAVESSAADIIVMADADVICDGVEDAIHAVEDGAPWAVPHTMVHRLDAAGTDRFVAGDNSSPSYQQAPYRGVLGGGMVIARREVVLSIPPDCRFVGWG